MNARFFKYKLGCPQFKGGAGRETVLFIFQPNHFIEYYDQYEKICIKNISKQFPRGSFHGNGGHIERGSSVVERRTRNRESPGSNPPLLPFRRVGIFFHSIDAPVDSAV